MDTIAHQEGMTHEYACPFPAAVLPVPLRTVVNEVAAALPCPPDFVAVPMLALLGAAIGNSRVLEVKPGWRESARLWTAVVADPGSKKSPALAAVMRPLEERQRQLHEAYQHALEASQAGGSLNAPVLQQLFTTDATLEALAVILAQNPRGLVFIRDELTGWVRAMNQYKGGKGADRQSWLSFWNGATVIVNRVSRQGPIVLDNPFVSVTGCLPPDVLGELADERGREDGFIHRILFAFPNPIPLAWTDAALSLGTQQDYTLVFTALWGLQPATLSGESQVPAVVQFTSEGRTAFVTWINTHYTEMGS
jgi:hypothetical protein